jgi:hypothetical protein
LIEPLRPLADRWVLDYLAKQTFDQTTFKEGGDGRVILDRTIKTELGDTAPLWQRAAVPLAEKVAQMFLDVPIAAEFAGYRRKLQPVKVTRATRPVQPKIETKNAEYAELLRGSGGPRVHRVARTIFEQHRW